MRLGACRRAIPKSGQLSGWRAPDHKPIPHLNLTKCVSGRNPATLAGGAVKVTGSFLTRARGSSQNSDRRVTSPATENAAAQATRDRAASDSPWWVAAPS